MPHRKISTTLHSTQRARLRTKIHLNWEDENATKDEKAPANRNQSQQVFTDDRTRCQHKKTGSQSTVDCVQDAIARY
jgi:hypothetical protein